MTSLGLRVVPSTIYKSCLEECLMCFQRARGYGWLEKVSLRAGCIRCLCLDFSPFSPLFVGSIVLWIQRLNAAGSGLLYPAVSSSQGDANIVLGYRNVFKKKKKEKFDL